MVRKSRSTHSPRHAHKRTARRDNVLAFLQSNRLDNVADYVRRGRKHAALSDNELVAAWKAAFAAMAMDPFSQEVRDADQDLSSEFDLRKKVPPYAKIRDLMDAFTKRVEAEGERTRPDPDAWAEMNEAMIREVEEFTARRDQSKN